MSHARMVRLALRDRLQDSRAFELLGVKFCRPATPTCSERARIESAPRRLSGSAAPIAPSLRIGTMRVRWSTLSWSAYIHGERVDVVALTLRLAPTLLLFAMAKAPSRYS